VPSTLASILADPKLALIITLFFGACAFSGKFSIAATRCFLLMTWAVAVLFFSEIRALRSRRLLFIAAIIFSGLLLLVFALWLQPEKTVASAGVIAPRRELFSSTAPKNPRIEIGHSGDIVEISGPSPAFTLILYKNSSLKVEVENGKLLVSTQIRNAAGNLIAEIVRNEWKSFPAAWDRNYDDDTFEVRNEKGNIVLQIRALPDRIQLQGEWPSEGGQTIRLVDSKRPNAPLGSRGLIARYSGADDSKIPKIEPLFKYPSERHLGELKVSD
jgi:hypothetical protein